MKHGWLLLVVVAGGALTPPARAAIPVIDTDMRQERQKRDDAASKIEDAAHDSFSVNQSVSCSMFREGNVGDPVDAAHANPEITGLVRRIAREEGVDENQFLALVYQESRFNPCAQSGAGAIGLAQLMPGTAAGLGVNPNDIEDNLRGGARYYKQQLRRYDGNVRLALAAYNAGPGNVDKYGGVPPFEETQGYVGGITQKWLPAFGGSDVSAIPMNYGGGSAAFSSMRTSTINAMATNQAINDSTGNVASWLEQLGGVQTHTIQDSWDHNSAARNANLGMLNQTIRLGATIAALLNASTTMSLSTLSGSSQSTSYADDSRPDRDVTGSCDPHVDFEWDATENASCIGTSAQPVDLMLQPQ